MNNDRTSTTQLLTNLFRQSPGNVGGHNRVAVGFSILVVLMIYSTIEHEFLHRTFISNFMPWMMFKLTALDWQNLILTLFAVLVSFLVSTSLALFLAVLRSRFLLARGHLLPILSAVFEAIYRFFYIIPVVVSIALIIRYVIPFKFYADQLELWIIWLVIFTLPTLFISGHPIFSAFCAAVTEPDDRHRMLVDSLYEKPGRVFRGRLNPGIKRVFRLAGGNIVSICHDVELSWHLAIVAVVIVETVYPGVHSDVIPSWLKYTKGFGVGGAVLNAQNAIDVPRVFGFMWALFVVDWIGLLIIRALLRTAYMRHYSGR